MKKKITLLMAGSILALATIASAGNKADTFSVSPMVGGITFDGNQHLQTSPVFGVRAGYNFTKAFGVEALFDYSRTESTRSNNTLDLYRYGGELLYHFWPDNKFVPYLAAGYARMDLKGGNNPYPFASKTRGVIDYGLGFKYFVTEDIAWRTDVRGLTYYYSNEDHHAIEYTTGVYIPFGGAKSITKLADPPPAPAPVAPVPVAKPVVVPPPVPTASLLATPESITKGQSSVLTWKSTNASVCDLQPAIGPVRPQGTVTVTPGDNTEYFLSCTGEGGIAKSSAVVTVLAPVVQISAAAERFCNKPAILKINFDTDKYNIKPQYHNELKSVGDFLKEFPKSKGEISGHTDSTASNQYNQKLSERRAESVKKYIIKNFGIAPERIRSKGYGEDKPIATNKTKAGRALNRRIEANFDCE